MTRKSWDFVGTHDAAVNALEEATGAGPGEPLVLTFGPKQLEISFAVFEFRTQLPYVQGLAVFTRKVTIEADLPDTTGFRKSLDEASRQGVLDAAERIARQVETALRTKQPPLEYQKKQTGTDVGYKAAMHDDFYSGILPFELVVTNSDGSDEGNGVGWLEAKLVRKVDGCDAGTLRVRTWALSKENEELGSIRYNSTALAELSLTEATRAEAELMDRAMRSWIRGKALSDRLPLNLPDGGGQELQT